MNLSLFKFLIPTVHARNPHPVSFFPSFLVIDGTTSSPVMMLSLPNFLVLFCLLLHVHAELVNTHVKRVIDVTTTTAITRISVTLKNEGSSAISHYEFPLPPESASNVNDVWATDGKTSKPLPISFSSSSSSSSAYQITLSSTLQPSESCTIDIRYDVSKACIPVPSELRKHESQYLRYSFNPHVYSLYKTRIEQTSLLLPSSMITSNAGIPTPHKQNGKRLELGPYKDTPSKSYDESKSLATVRFQNDQGFLIAKRAHKEVRAGHWGTVAVTEEFQLRNGAATHRGEWSRLDYEAGKLMNGGRGSASASYKTAIGDIWANMPPSATNVQYTDLIGNITTSRLRKKTKSKRAVQLTFRFPLMGGWKNHFWFSYDIPHETIVKQKDQDQNEQDKAGMYEMKVPIWPTFNTDLYCERFTLKVIMPEWAEQVHVVDHPSIKFEKHLYVERMSVTIFGRPIVTLKASMIRTRSKHDPYITVRYSYNPALRWLTPTLTVAGVLMVIVISLMLVLRNIDIDVVDVPGTKEKTQ